MMLNHRTLSPTFLCGVCAEAEPGLPAFTGANTLLVYEEMARQTNIGQKNTRKTANSRLADVPRVISLIIWCSRAPGEMLRPSLYGITADFDDNMSSALQFPSIKPPLRRQIDVRLGCSDASPLGNMETVAKYNRQILNSPKRLSTNVHPAPLS